MTNEPDAFDRKLNKTKKIIALIVVPILFMVVGLMLISDFSSEKIPEEKPTYVEMLSEIDLHCYNINWFGTFGFQVTYNESMQKIGEKLDEYDIDFTANEFFETQEVIDYLVITCPHINSKLDAPDQYDPTIGVPALDKCLQVKQGTVDSEDYCLQFK